MNSLPMPKTLTPSSPRRIMADLPELLSPAGDMERLRMALLYGADADPLRVFAAVRKLEADGSVLALRALPEGICCRRVARLTESGVILDA